MHGEKIMIVGRFTVPAKSCLERFGTAAAGTCLAGVVKKGRSGNTLSVEVRFNEVR